MHRNLLRTTVSRHFGANSARSLFLAGLIGSIIGTLPVDTVAQPAIPPVSPQAPPIIEQRPGRPTFRNDTVYTYRPDDSGPAARMPGCPADRECAPRARATRVPQ